MYGVMVNETGGGGARGLVAVFARLLASRFRKYRVVTNLLDGAEGPEVVISECAASWMKVEDVITGSECKEAQGTAGRPLVEQAKHLRFTRSHALLHHHYTKARHGIIKIPLSHSVCYANFVLFVYTTLLHTARARCLQTS